MRACVCCFDREALIIKPACDPSLLASRLGRPGKPHLCVCVSEDEKTTDEEEEGESLGEKNKETPNWTLRHAKLGQERQVKSAKGEHLAKLGASSAQRQWSRERDKELTF